MERYDDIYERDMREQEQDGWDDDCCEFEEQGLDPGFASWNDYLNYKYGHSNECLSGTRTQV